MSIDLMRDKPTVGMPIGQGTNGSGAQLQPVNPAYNTYVGARYVPIFAGEWDATKTYEPLTIVMWQGNSYTSKTFVPAQTEISNEDFWALTGNYNAQVEVYRQEVEKVVNSFNELSIKFDDISVGFVSEKEWGVCTIIKSNINIIIDFCGLGDIVNTPLALSHLNIDHLDIGLISHFHQDHVQGIINGVFDNIIDEQTTFFIPNKPLQQFIDADNYLLTTYNSLIAKLSSLNAKIMPAVPSVKAGDLEITMSNLDHTYYAKQTKLNYNDCSLIFRVKKNDASLLYFGDSTYITWAHLNYNFPQSTIMTAPHHGASQCYSPQLLNAVRPKQAVTLTPTDAANTAISGTFNAGCAINGISNVFTFSYPNNTYYLDFNSFSEKRNVLISVPSGVINSWPELFSASSFEALIKSFNNNTTFNLELSPSELTDELVADGNLGTQIYLLQGHKNSHGSVYSKLINMSRLTTTYLWVNSTNEFFATGEGTIGLNTSGNLEYITNQNFLSWNDNILTFNFKVTGDSMANYFVSLYNPASENATGTIKIGSHVVSYIINQNSYGGCFDLSGAVSQSINFEVPGNMSPKINVAIKPRRFFR